VEAGIFIAMIFPGVSLIFSAAFLALWLHQPKRRYLFALSGSCIALGIGFTFQYFVLFNDLFSRLISNLALLVGVCGFLSGCLARHDRRRGIWRITGISVCGFAVYLWFLYGDHDIIMRIFVINFTISVMMFSMALDLLPTERRHLIDKAALCLLFIWSATSFFRPFIATLVEEPPSDYETLRTSLYWFTLAFSALMFMILFPLIQIISIALEILDDLKQESVTDSLSGLLNRRGFEEASASRLELAQRKGLSMTLVVCDLDRFKSINDTFGHAVGDEVIKVFSACLSDALQHEHIVGRVGGEEFSILLEGMNDLGAKLFCEGIRTQYSALPVDGLPDKLPRTASFGVAEWTPGESVRALFLRADIALYEAKNTGRDCVRVARKPEALRQEAVQQESQLLIR
jgi:diguanylate cyclase (GGDEF)-like protein